MVPSLSRLDGFAHRIICLEGKLLQHRASCPNRSICTKQLPERGSTLDRVAARKLSNKNDRASNLLRGMTPQGLKTRRIPVNLEIWQGAWQRYLLGRQFLGILPSEEGSKHDSIRTLATFPKGVPETSNNQPGSFDSRPTFKEHLRAQNPFKLGNSKNSPKSSREQAETDQQKEHVKFTRARRKSVQTSLCQKTDQPSKPICPLVLDLRRSGQEPMSSESPNTSAPDTTTTDTPPAQHKPLVVGLKKPAQSDTMASNDAAAALNKEIEENVQANTASAAPADAAEGQPPKPKKEKAPKQPKKPAAAAAAAPTSPALIDLRVGHILRAIAHPNADSLYVSTIAMGDPEGTEHTQVDEETGKVVRTVCSGLKAYIPLEEMQDRKIIVVANLKPVNMRSVKSAAMVLAASPKQEEGADPHAADRVVELVIPPQGAEAGDKVYFEGWPYGEGKGPEKVLNPKKKQWEAIQPGFFTDDDLKVGFNASVCDEVEGSEKGHLVVEGKGVCTVKSLKGAVVR